MTKLEIDYPATLAAANAEITRLNEIIHNAAKTWPEVAKKWLDSEIALENANKKIKDLESAVAIAQTQRNDAWDSLQKVNTELAISNQRYTILIEDLRDRLNNG